MAPSRNNANCILCENKKCKGKESWEFVADNGCNKIVLKEGKKVKAKVNKKAKLDDDQYYPGLDWDPGW